VKRISSAVNGRAFGSLKSEELSTSGAPFPKTNIGRVPLTASATSSEALSVEVRKNGYSLLILSSDEEPNLEREEIEQLLARRVDVLLVASAQWTIDSFLRIEESKTPYILLDCQLAGLEANFVGVDDKTVGVLAASHLIEQGCECIAHIRGPEISTALGRLEGYEEALAEYQMVPLQGHVVSIGSSGDHRGERGGYEAATRLLANKRRPDGIFCFNDPVALGAMRAILDAGLRIPEDIAVVGCGNLPYSDFLRVPLTSVDQGSSAIGKRAAALALHLANNAETMRPKSEVIRPHIVVRASSLRTDSTLQKQAPPIRAGANVVHQVPRGRRIKAK
jgi:LacI family transcriptional regulator